MFNRGPRLTFQQSYIIHDVHDPRCKHGQHEKKMYTHPPPPKHLPTNSNFIVLVGLYMFIVLCYDPVLNLLISFVLIDLICFTWPLF